MATQYLTLSLTSLNKESGFVDVRRGNRASVSIGLNSEKIGQIIKSTGGTFTWTSAVVKMQWSLDKLNFFDFDSAVTFTTSTQARAGVSVSGMNYIRFVTTTAEGASDPSALVTVVVT